MNKSFRVCLLLFFFFFLPLLALVVSQRETGAQYGNEGYVPVVASWPNRPYSNTSETEPNNSWNQADGALIDVREVKGRFSNKEDEKDYYFFYQGQEGPVKLRLTGIGSGHNYDLVLRDSNLEQVGYSGELENSDENIGKRLGQGLYYVQVYNRSQTGSSQSYSLVVDYMPPPPPAPTWTPIPTITPTPTPSATPKYPSGIDSIYWPTDRHDAARTGYNRAEKELYPPLEPVWYSEVDSHYIQEITSVGDDVAVTGQGPSDDGRPNYVIMIDSKSRSTKWEFTLPNGGRSSMQVAATFDATSVYFGGQHDTHFYSLFRNSGSTKWQRPGFQNLIYNQPVVVDGTVYIGDSSVGVLALSTGSGELIWGEGYSGLGRYSPVAWRDGAVYGIRNRDELVAFDAASGVEKWTFSPVYYDQDYGGNRWIIAGSNRFYVKSGESEFKAHNSANGGVLYTKPFNSGVLGGAEPVLAEGRLFVVVQSKEHYEGEIIALNAANGGSLWSYNANEYVRDIVAANGILYAAVGDRKVLALNQASGDLVWSSTVTDYNIRASLAVSDGTLYVGGWNRLYAFQNAR